MKKDSNQLMVSSGRPFDSNQLMNQLWVAAENAADVEQLVIRDATFFSKPITGTAPHHQIANNYRPLPADCGSLPANYQHLYDSL